MTLSLWAKVHSFEGADEAHVRVSPDGVSWTTVKTFTAAESDNTYREVVIDLSGFQMTADFRIAIDAEMNHKKDRLYVDDIRIAGVR